MKKGDIVRVKAKIFTVRRDPQQYVNTRNFIAPVKEFDFAFSVLHVPNHSHNNWYYIKSLVREEFPIQTFLGLLLGTTYIATGLYNPGSYDEPGYLKEDKRHVCWKVEPLQQERYLRPVLCLEDDLEMVQTLYFKMETYARTKSELEKRALLRTR